MSIITVCFNASSTILDTIHSVNKQTSCTEIEHIFVDGFSDDGTLELIRSNSRVNFRIFQTPKLGVYNAMNVGLLNASGEFVIFLNADDYFIDNLVLYEFIDIVRDFPLVNVVAGNVDYIESNGSLSRRWNVSKKDLYDLSQLPHPGLMVSRDLLINNNLFFDEKLILSGDYKQQLLFKSHLHYKPLLLGRTVVQMRAGGLSNSSIWARLTGVRECFESVCRVHGLLISCSFILVKLTRAVIARIKYWLKLL